MDDRLIPLALSALVAGELLLGLGLLLGWGGRAMILVGIAVLGVYSAQLGYLLAFERAPDCNCIAKILQFRSAREGHIVGLIRNGLMILALAGTALFAGRPHARVVTKGEACLP